VELYFHSPMRLHGGVKHRDITTTTTTTTTTKPVTCSYFLPTSSMDARLTFVLLDDNLKFVNCY
jgi:hypothetical protein